jgi:N-acetylmuramoyl-L-alanine amidase
MGLGRLPLRLRAPLLCTAVALALGGCGKATSAVTRADLSSGRAAANAYALVRAPSARATAVGVRMPHIRWDPIPFPQSRKFQMLAYARRHYGLDTYRLIAPRVIVEHYTDTPDFQSTYNTFAPDHPDSELHELPNTCAHFVVDRAGVIHQLVALDIMCRHTVGLNYTAIGIENVGYSDAEILHDPAQLHASLQLTRWLRCRHGIAVRNVIGHSESLDSPYHHENVPVLRTQTHSDWSHADMGVYRRLLRGLGCGPRLRALGPS